MAFRVPARVGAGVRSAADASLNIGALPVRRLAVEVLAPRRAVDLQSPARRDALKALAAPLAARWLGMARSVAPALGDALASLGAEAVIRSRPDERHGALLAWDTLRSAQFPSIAC